MTDVDVGSGVEVKDRPAGLPGPSAARVPWTERAIGVWTIRGITALVVFGAWELYGRASNPALFAPPSRVVSAFKEIAIDESILWHAIADSLAALAIGFSAAIVVGTFVGLLMGRIRTIEYLLDPYVSFLYALPTIVIVPLLIIWLGIGAETRVAIVFTTSIVPVLLNTMAGAKRVKEEYLEVGKNYGANGRQMMRTVVLPSILPYVFTGINVAIGSAIIGMILGELLIVIRGIGGLVVTYSNSFQPDKVFVALGVLVMLSVILTSLLRQTRLKLMPWTRKLQR